MICGWHLAFRSPGPLVSCMPRQAWARLPQESSPSASSSTPATTLPAATIIMIVVTATVLRNLVSPYCVIQYLHCLTWLLSLACPLSPLRPSRPKLLLNFNLASLYRIEYSLLSRCLLVIEIIFLFPCLLLPQNRLHLVLRLIENGHLCKLLLQIFGNDPSVRPS